MEPRIYKIQMDCYDKLVGLVIKLNKRAQRLGVPLILLEELHTSDELQEDGITVKRFTHITLSAATIKLNGWHLVARVQWLAGEPVYFTAPRETVKGISLSSPRCDHCETARNRNDTFLVRHEDGRLAQVGSNCFADFMGHKDAAKMAEYLEMCIHLQSMLDEAEGDSGMWSSYSHTEYMRLDTFLTYTAMCIRLSGWVSTSKSRDTGKTSTAANVMDCLFPMPNARKDVPVPSEEDKALGRLALIWALSLYGKDSLSDYESNIATIAHAGVLTRKMTGYAASIVPAYQRAVNPAWQPGAPKPVKPASAWLGSIGEKLELAVKVVFTLSIPGFRPDTSTLLVKLEDDAGNKLVWFSSNPPDAVVTGNLLTLRGTVKQHGERDGEKQTILTRCKVISYMAPSQEINNA